MKRLLLVLVLLMTAGSLFAAELKVTGDAMVRGTSNTYDNDAADTTKTAMYFDYDFNINAALVANENATAFLRLTYDKTVAQEGKVDDGDGTANADALALERAYINYKFAPFLQLNTGLMGGGQWATAFGDNEINVMRVQFIGALSKDMIFIATYQKDHENGNVVTAKESAENTTYYLSAILRTGGIAFKPLLTYRVIGREPQLSPAFGAKPGDQITQYALTLGVDGDFGMVAFESEFVYTTVDAKVGNIPAIAFAGEDSLTAYGAYVNVWANLAPAKVGLAAVYASSDEDTAVNLTYGGDFDFTMIVDDMVWGSEDGLPGFTSFKLWAEAPVNEKLTLGAYFAYGMATDSKATKYNATLDGLLLQKLTGSTAGVIGADLSYWEANLSATYALDANTAYKVEAGYASLDNADAKTTDVRYVVRHRMTVKF